MIDRRSLILAAGAALVTGPARAGGIAARRDTMELWPGMPPGGGGPTGRLRITPGGAISNVARPTLTIHLPARPNGGAMLVAAGGGYKRIEQAKEADAAADWLVARGLTAFVLTYRLPLEGWAAGPLAPLQDAQRALRLIAATADRYGIDRQRIGALGFSAGGHLMGMAAARSAYASYAPVDAADHRPARPATAALIYPVITLEPPYQHTSTHRSLVGDHPARGADALWSVQSWVDGATPPIFMVQALDDRISNPANTVIMAEACRRAGVPVDLLRPPSGGHGFAMGRPGTASAAWPGWFEGWLRAQRLLR